ncbi:MAG: M23 family metallopeptidase [Parcubacteria group bacterium]|nr:M23 family metallopeptidase [Parcubacteria group bacterium]
MQDIRRLVAAFLRNDFRITWSTITGRTRKFLGSVALMLAGILICITAAVTTGNPAWYLACAVITLVGYAYQAWCVAIPATLVIANYEFARVATGALRKLLVAAKVPPDKVNQAIEDIRTRFTQIINQPEGEFGDMLMAIVNQSLRLLEIPGGIISITAEAMEGTVAEIDKAIQALPGGIKRKAKEQAAPFLYFFMNLEWLSAVYFAFLAFSPETTTILPHAAVLICIGLIAVMLPTRKELPSHLSKFSKWMVAATLASVALLYWQYLDQPFGVAPETSWMLALAGLGCFAIFMMNLFGVRLGISIMGLAVAALYAFAQENSERILTDFQTKVRPGARYYTVARHPGALKRYPVDEMGDSLETRSRTTWSSIRNRQHYFRPKPNPGPNEMLGAGTKLQRPSNWTVVGKDNVLYTIFLLVDGDDLVIPGSEFFLPLEDKWVHEMPQDVAPRVAVYYSHELAGRIDPREGEESARMRRARWVNYSPFTWHGYSVPRGIFQHPLADPQTGEVPDEVSTVHGGTFFAPRGTDRRHNAIDFATAGKSLPVYACFGGVVEEVTIPSSGTYGSVIIKHNPLPGVEDELWTEYGHLRQIEPIAVGERVDRGTLLGYVGGGPGDPGRGNGSTGRHLHFAVYRQVPGGRRQPVDPLPYLDMAAENSVTLAGISVYPRIVSPDENGDYLIPPDAWVVEIAGIALNPGDDIEIEAPSGTIYPDDQYGSRANRETGPQGLDPNWFPELEKYELPVPGVWPAALVAGFGGLQHEVAGDQPTVLKVPSNYRGALYLGINEPVRYKENKRTGAYVPTPELVANNTGEGFRVRINHYPAAVDPQYVQDRE